MYLIARVNLKPGELERFGKMIARVAEITEAHWKLHEIFANIIGPIGQVTDIWQFDDFDSLTAGREKLFAHPEYPQIAELLREIVDHEETVLADKAPFSP